MLPSAFQLNSFVTFMKNQDSSSLFYLEILRGYKIVCVYWWNNQGINRKTLEINAVPDHIHFYAYISKPYLLLNLWRLLSLIHQNGS